MDKLGTVQEEKDFCRKTWRHVKTNQFMNKGRSLGTIIYYEEIVYNVILKGIPTVQATKFHKSSPCSKQAIL
jgi:hypothetical protein